MRNINSKYYLSIDIGGTYTKYTYINQKLLFKKIYKIKTPANLKALLIELDKMITNTPFNIMGIGISCPGRVDTDTGTVYSGGALPYLDKFSFKKYFKTKFNIHCYVNNDGKAAVLSESLFGNLKNIENGAAIILGTGIGGGIIANKTLLLGDNFQAGELSFMINNLDGSLSSSLAGYSASAVNFITEASKLLGHSDLNNGEKVFAAINKGKNKELLILFETYCIKVAKIILNLQAVIDVSKVVIGGGISVQNILIEKIIESYNLIRKNNILIKKTFKPVEIEACEFLSESNLIGAISPFLLEV